MATQFEQIEAPYVLGETSDYIAVFKPAGMHSVPVGTNGLEADLLSWFALNRPDAVGAFSKRDPETGNAEFGMISRLDRGTSGIILFAKTPGLRRTLFEFAAQGGIAKEYRLIASPSSRPLPGSLPGQRPIALRTGTGSAERPSDWIVVESYFRSYGERSARVACIDVDRADECQKKLTKKTYATKIRAEGEAPDAAQDALVLSARIGAGFRHQIRAHLAWSGYPILGDSDYGGAGARRLFLEAHRIEVGGTNPAVFELYGNLHGD
jgi:23S rRNA pseudouridine1911/1915/1917 synthase